MIKEELCVTVVWLLEKGHQEKMKKMDENWTLYI